jgi:hypothetical protein
MPDLNQIKQGEQGARDRHGRFAKGRSGDHSGRRIGSRNKATLAAAALLAGESEALTRRAVELALFGDPTAMRLCLERILRPCRERTVKFALPPIESASAGLSAEGARYGRGDEGGHLRRWPAALSRRARRRGSRRSSTPLSGVRAIDARNSTGACRNSKTDPRRALRPALQSGVALVLQPIGECLLLICLQMQQRVIYHSI